MWYVLDHNPRKPKYKVCQIKQFRSRTSEVLETCQICDLYSPGCSHSNYLLVSTTILSSSPELLTSPIKVSSLAGWMKGRLMKQP